MQLSPVLGFLHARLRRPTRPTMATLTAMAITVGVLLRLTAFASRRSLWLDEVSLALNITGRSFAQLWQPLDHDQGAPVAFLTFMKLATSLFGSSELALRLVPMAAAVAALLLFARVARRFLPSDGACFAVALFAVAPKLTYYAGEVKQYSSDVLIAVVLLWLAGPALVGGRPRVHWLALGGAAALWCSHPAAFVLAGIGIVLALRAWREDVPSSFRPLALVASAWAASFLLCYVVCLRHLSRNNYLLTYWAEFFAPVPPIGFDQLGWYLRAFTGLFDNPGGIAVADVSLAAPAALLWSFGLYAMGRRRPWLAAGLIAPLAVTLLASAVQRYPFGGRLLLFALPFACLGLGSAWSAIRSSAAPGDAGRIAVAMAALVLMAPAATSLQHALRPAAIEESRPVLAAMAAKWRPGDVVYLSSMADRPFEYYGPRLGLDIHSVVGQATRGDWSAVAEDVENLLGRSRVWVFITHERPDDRKYLQTQFERLGRRRDAVTAVGAEAWLYELR